MGKFSTPKATPRGIAPPLKVSPAFRQYIKEMKFTEAHNKNNFFLKVFILFYQNRNFKSATNFNSSGADFILQLRD